MFEFSKKYPEYFNFLYTLHSHLKKTMLRNRFEIFSRRKLNQLIRRFEHNKNFFRKERKISKIRLEKNKKKNSL